MNQANRSDYQECVARSYDSDRSQERHWCREEEYVRALIARLQPAQILDAPVGTGRFVPLYGSSAFVMGLDLSSAMLREAVRHLHHKQANLHLVRGSMLALPFKSQSFELGLCCRFLHLLNAEQVGQAMIELARVTRRHLYVQAYVRGPTWQRIGARLLRVARDSTGASREPWRAIAAYTHSEALLLHAAKRAGLRLVARDRIDRYHSTLVMFYGWEHRL